MDDRAEAYHVLVDARKACRLCSGLGLANASEVHGGDACGHGRLAGLG